MYSEKDTTQKKEIFIEYVWHKKLQEQSNSTGAPSDTKEMTHSQKQREIRKILGTAIRYDMTIRAAPRKDTGNGEKK